MRLDYDDDDLGVREPDPPWTPVEIQARTPNTSDVLLHHRHGEGIACAACEIVALREELRLLKGELERRTK